MFPSLYGAVSQGAAAAGWWVVAGKTCVAAYQPIGAASLAASYTNLANPGTYNAAPGTAPTWASGTGWTFNGSNQYLTTGYFPTGGGSAIVRFVNITTDIARDLFGVFDGAAVWRITPYQTLSDCRLQNVGAGYDYLTGLFQTGVLAFTATKAYRNGGDEQSMSGTSSGTLTKAAFIGAVNNNGSPGRYINGSIVALAIYSDTLTAGEVATLSSAMAALT